MKKLFYLSMAIAIIVVFAYPAYVSAMGNKKPKHQIINYDKICERNNWKTFIFRKKCICRDFEAVLTENTEEHMLITWPDNSEYAKKYHIRFYVNGKKELSETIDKNTHEYAIPQKPEYEGAKLFFVVKIVPERRVGFPCSSKLRWMGEAPEPPEPPETCDMAETVQLNDMPETTVPEVAKPRDGFIYLVGGHSAPGPGGACSAKILKYEIATDTTTDLGNVLPYAMYPQAPSTMTWADNGKLYISPALGPTINNGWGSHKCVVEYDPVTNTGQEKACFPSTIWGMSVINGNDGYLYFLGGWDGSGKNDIWRYDPIADTLTDTGVDANNIANKHHDLLEMGDGTAYIPLNSEGGYDLYRFDSSGPSVTLVKDGNTSAGGAMWQDNGKIYGLGGEPEYWSKLSIYDPALDELTVVDLEQSLFPYPSASIVADTDTNRLYSFGGTTGSTFYPDVYRTECLGAESGIINRLTIPDRKILGLDYDDGALWVTHYPTTGGDYVKIAKMNPETGDILSESQEFNRNGRSITVAEGDLWISDAKADDIFQLDPDTFATINNFDTPGTEPTGITYDGTNLWLVDPYYEKIYQLSKTGDEISSFYTPNEYRSGLEWEDGKLLTSTGATQLSYYETDGTLGDSIQISGLPEGLFIYDIALGDDKIFISTTNDTIYIKEWQ